MSIINSSINITSQSTVVCIQGGAKHLSFSNFCGLNILVNRESIVSESERVKTGTINLKRETNRGPVNVGVY